MEIQIRERSTYGEEITYQASILDYFTMLQSLMLQSLLSESWTFDRSNLHESTSDSRKPHNEWPIKAGAVCCFCQDVVLRSRADVYRMYSAAHPSMLCRTVTALMLSMIPSVHWILRGSAVLGLLRSSPFRERTLPARRRGVFDLKIQTLPVSRARTPSVSAAILRSANCTTETDRLSADKTRGPWIFSSLASAWVLPGNGQIPIRKR